MDSTLVARGKVRAPFHRFLLWLLPWAALLGVGLYAGLDEIASNWRIDRVFEPVIGADERETRHERWRAAVARSLDWA